MRKGLTILAAASVLLAASFKKNDKEAVVTVQNLAGTYKIVKISVKADNSAETDITDYLLEPCAQDDTYALQADLSYHFVDAGATCGSAGLSSTWSLKGQNKIVLDGETMNIRKFDGKKLELTSTDVYNGVSSTFATYYVKQ